MNSQAVELQRRVGTSIITRFHALWSAGAVTGGHRRQPRRRRRHLAALPSCSPPPSCSSSRDAAGVAVAAARPRGGPPSTPAARAADEPRAPRRMLVHLFLVGMAIALAELPPHDWSALLLHDRFDVTGRAGRSRLRRRGQRHAGRAARSATTPPTGSGSSGPGAAAPRSPRRASPIATLAPSSLGRRRGPAPHRHRPVDAVPAAVPSRQRADPRLPQRHGGVLQRGPARVPVRLAVDGCDRRGGRAWRRPCSSSPAPRRPSSPSAGCPVRTSP